MAGSIVYSGSFSGAVLMGRTVITLDEFAKRAISVPFVEYGRDWNGWDCWGLVVTCYREVYSVDLPSHVGEYGSTRRRLELQQLIAAQKTMDWSQVSEGSQRAGDAVLLRLLGRACHIGVMLSPRMVIHTEERVNTVIEDLGRTPWRGPGFNNVQGFFRHADAPV